MRKQWIVLLVGALFGVGLSVAGMINPNKVQGFLDIFGNWDPSLMFVMGSAVLVTMLGYRYILKHPHPLLSKAFIIPSRDDLDAPLIVGAALFGIGWGMAGFCPGPAVTALATGSFEPVLVVFGMFIGSGLVGKFYR